MKGFLQAVGVLTKDDDTTATPSQAPAQAVAPTSASVEAPAVNQSASPVDTVIADEALATMKAVILKGMREGSGLSPLFSMLDSMERLKRISDIKERVLTALDFEGYKTSDITGFAIRFADEVKRVSQRVASALKAEVLQESAAAQARLEEVNKKVDALRRELESAESEQSNLKQQVADAAEKMVQTEATAQAAADSLNAEFQPVMQTLQNATDQ